MMMNMKKKSKKKSETNVTTGISSDAAMVRGLVLEKRQLRLGRENLIMDDNRGGWINGGVSRKEPGSRLLKTRSPYHQPFRWGGRRGGKGAPPKRGWESKTGEKKKTKKRGVTRRTRCAPSKRPQPHTGRGDGKEIRRKATRKGRKKRSDPSTQPAWRVEEEKETRSSVSLLVEPSDFWRPLPHGSGSITQRGNPLDAAGKCGYRGSKEAINHFASRIK